MRAYSVQILAGTRRSRMSPPALAERLQRVHGSQLNMVTSEVVQRMIDGFRLFVLFVF